MNFEKTESEEFPIKLVFTTELEVQAVKAMFCEHIVRLARKGNTSSISDYDRSIASWDTAPNKSTLLRGIDSFRDKLDIFVASTDEAISEIANNTLTPPFDNDDILTRYELGQIAIGMLGDIDKEESAPPEDPEEIVIEEADIDDAITKIFAEEN